MFDQYVLFALPAVTVLALPLSAKLSNWLIVGKNQRSVPFAVRASQVDLALFHVLASVPIKAHSYPPPCLISAPEELDDELEDEEDELDEDELEEDELLEEGDPEQRSSTASMHEYLPAGAVVSIKTLLTGVDVVGSGIVREQFDEVLSSVTLIGLPIILLLTSLSVIFVTKP